MQRILKILFVLFVVMLSQSFTQKIPKSYTIDQNKLQKIADTTPSGNIQKN